LAWPESLFSLCRDEFDGGVDDQLSPRVRDEIEARIGDLFFEQSVKLQPHLPQVLGDVDGSADEFNPTA